MRIARTILPVRDDQTGSWACSGSFGLRTESHTSLCTMEPMAVLPPSHAGSTQGSGDERWRNLEINPSLGRLHADHAGELNDCGTGHVRLQGYLRCVRYHLAPPYREIGKCTATSTSLPGSSAEEDLGLNALHALHRQSDGRGSGLCGHSDMT